MSALPQVAQAVSPADLVWRPLDVASVERILPIEQQVYSHPWTRGNFIDSIAAGHKGAVGLLNDDVVCYWVAMTVLDEVHLLNVAVAREHWGQGLGQAAMAHLLAQARAAGADQVWLEVRVSNARAIALYARLGFEPMGLRRAYYPLDPHRREDARLMRHLLRPT
ncbi:MAG: ribosomal protein S18-alanine N-acetyltransferase [Inhella sp.]|jgi:ribosomal-protein-alanine N-acetyltransferase|uniref:ribosomal protein S18-alanine N-acetyltransferase n=1 Tax=Inhella sp. TaxID=1921806 RepID=UPI0022BFA304|nr:ribosomal protein S18-alanine N-acetyltransferase [Inhella sp.]MCZ8235257.1 ribosomal protein S18-alanine N-acetyltransferase [Inhella sp.]